MLPSAAPDLPTDFTLFRRDSIRRSALMDFDELAHELIRIGGPIPSDYAVLNQRLLDLGQEVRAGRLSRREVLLYVRDLTKRNFDGTLQAQALERKHGYSGDFEMIDAIYQQRISPLSHLCRWDLFFHAQAAPVAVRNRKAYFQRLLDQHYHELQKAPLRVLNVASGPARDLREWLLDHPEAEARFDCIDADVHAIEHARKLCSPFLDRLEFHHRNAMRFLPGTGYDLVWSAGLFDYLMDHSFVFLLKSLLAVTRPGGEVVIGNFSQRNPSRDYMELLGDWSLHHRTEKALAELAKEAGAAPDSVTIDWEPQGVNLFLRVRRSA
jgi:extracellular factor (EF) 3-hydroxypalmitic acid methyl ester biosynthesis protein